MKVMLFIFAAVSLVAVTYSFTKSKKPVVSAIKSAVCGISGLLFVNMTSAFTGCYIAVNYFTAFIATVLSLPGIIAMLLLNILLT